MPANDHTSLSGKKRPSNPNRLAGESSPYLLQHAFNPVDWYPWGEEAFRQAREKDRPVFLSIGYSTCHWCHVMAHESFEDEGVASLMNRAFICIKVDREERPDIDALYMSVAQKLTGSGGWPLTIIMTPEKEPFFAATYISKESRFGMTGLLDLIPEIEHFWKSRPGNVRDIVKKIGRALQEDRGGSDAGTLVSESLLHAAYHDLALRFDSVNGGFSNAPKFPVPHTILFLLRYWRRTGNKNALAMAEKTLWAMSAGGIYDHLGYGFHRYSTDSRWLVPHFEKMLYDQALLVTAYTEAYLATGTMSFRITAEECLSYLLRDMRDPGGGFYSAEDADSEGVEGKFYLWSRKEVEELLGEDAPLFTRTYHVTTEGNFITPGTSNHTGENILHRTPLTEQPGIIGRTQEGDLQRLSHDRDVLFANRETRVPPLKDDKVLTDWNGLVISAFSLAARVFGEERYLNAAVGAADFILGTMRAGTGELFHRYRNGSPGIRGVASDYAFLCSGLLDLFELTFSPGYLEAAIRIEEYFSSHFLDKKNGGYFNSHEDESDLLVRQKDIYDGALPSVNSIAMKNLVRLGLMTNNQEYHARAWELAGSFSRLIEQSPSGYTAFLSALDFALGPSASVVVVGNKGTPDMVAMVTAINSRYFPSTVVLQRPCGEGPFEIDRLSGFTGEMREIEGRATAYVCKNHACSRPTIDPGTMIDDLEGIGRKQEIRNP